MAEDLSFRDPAIRGPHVLRLIILPSHGMLWVTASSDQVQESLHANRPGTALPHIRRCSVGHGCPIDRGTRASQKKEHAESV
jgi:hypothetical protein